MKLRCLTSTLLAAALATVLACGVAPDSEPPKPRVGVDTLHRALAQRDELERTYQLTRFLRSLGPEDVDAALAALEEHRVGITKDEVRLFMLAWTRFDAPGAFATARGWPTDWRNVLMEQAMRAWGFRDGHAALAALESVEDEALRTRLRIAMVEGWVSSEDRIGVSEYAASVEDLRRRNRLAFRLAGETMRDGPDAVIAWVEAIPDDAPNDFKSSVFAHAAGMVARADPSRVATWYEKSLNEPYSRGSLRNIASKWAEHHDPKALIEWLESLPLDETRASERPAAVAAAVRAWAADRPAQAEAWLQSLDPSPTRDRAIAEFANATAESDPAKAVEWVGRIEEETQRRKSLLRSTRAWFKQDRPSAEAWLAHAELPDGWRKQILDNLPRPERRTRVRKAPLDG